MLEGGKREFVEGLIWSVETRRFVRGGEWGRYTDGCGHAPNGAKERLTAH